LALLAVAHGFNYNVAVLNGSGCPTPSQAKPITTATITMVNGTACGPINFIGNNNTAYGVYLGITCNLNVNAEGVTAYYNSTFYPNNTCLSYPEFNMGNYTLQATTMCQNFPSLPNVSFLLTKNGGTDACAGLYALEKAIAGVFCVSGDTALPTVGGSVLAKDLEVGTPVLTPQGDFKPVQVFWHRVPESASCLRVCSKATRDCVTVSHEHLIRSSKGFETANTLSKDEFSVSTATCDGLVSFYVEGGAFMTQQGGLEVSCFSKTWGMGHDALLWFTEWSGVLMLPISDWTFFAETSRCLSKGVFACVFGSLSKLW